MCTSAFLHSMMLNYETDPCIHELFMELVRIARIVKTQPPSPSSSIGKLFTVSAFLVLAFKKHLKLLFDGVYQGLSAGEAGK